MNFHYVSDLEVRVLFMSDREHLPDCFQRSITSENCRIPRDEMPTPILSQCSFTFCNHWAKLSFTLLLEKAKITNEVLLV